MRNSDLKIKVFVVIFGLISISGFGQLKTEKDSLNDEKSSNFPIQEKNNRKNSLLLNITNPLLLSIQFQTIAYERVLKNNQTFTVSLGKFSLPKFGGDLADSLGLNTDYKDKGFHLGFDYRFYLKNENRYAAPRGVYIGPFYTYNYLDRKNSWYVSGIADEVFTNFKLNIHTVGFELGYQFVFWDRMAVDMILMGPGIGIYGLNTEIGANLDEAEKEELFGKINDFLTDKIPGYDKVIEPGEFKKNGTYNTVDIGFRYIVRIGYRF